MLRLPKTWLVVEVCKTTSIISVYFEHCKMSKQGITAIAAVIKNALFPY